MPSAVHLAVQAPIQLRPQYVIIAKVQVRQMEELVLGVMVQGKHMTMHSMICLGDFFFVQAIT